MKPKTVTCPCGSDVELGTTTLPPYGQQCYDVFSCECEACGRKPSSANTKDGTVHDWSTPAQRYAANKAMEQQQFDADMNEFYGRGNW